MGLLPMCVPHPLSTPPLQPGSPLKVLGRLLTKSDWPFYWTLVTSPALNLSALPKGLGWCWIFQPCNHWVSFFGNSPHPEAVHKLPATSHPISMQNTLIPLVFSCDWGNVCQDTGHRPNVSYYVRTVCILVYTYCVCILVWLIHFRWTHGLF